MNKKPKVQAVSKTIRIEPSLNTQIQEHCKDTGMTFATLTRELFGTFFDSGNSPVQSSTDKIVSIEQNVEKNNRRNEMAHQIATLVEAVKPSQVKCAGLSGEQWLFEHLLQNTFEMRGIETPLSFYSAESKRKVAIAAIKHMPENSVLAGGTSLHYLMTRELKVNNAGIASVVNPRFKVRKDFNVCWADYCGNICADKLKHLIEYAIQMKDGILHATFANVVRRTAAGNGNKLYRKLGLSQNDFGNSLINKIIQGCQKAGIKARKIYNVDYRGGKGSNMTTIGIAIGKYADVDIPVIEKDTRDTPHKKRSRSYWNNHKSDKRLFDNRGRRTKKTVAKKVAPKKQTAAQLNRELKELERELVYAMLDKGYTYAEIVKRSGLSGAKVRAHKAHFNNPESWNKTKTKKGK